MNYCVFFAFLIRIMLSIASFGNHRVWGNGNARRLMDVVIRSCIERLTCKQEFALLAKKCTHALL